MRFATLLVFVVPVFAQVETADMIANRLLQRLDSVVWNSGYKGGSSCRQFSASAYGDPSYSAVGAWSWHCDVTSAGITAESYYYVFSSQSALLRLDLGLSDANGASGTAVRNLLEAKLTQRFGTPAPPPRNYPLVPGGPRIPVWQWHTKSADLLLFDGPFYLSPLRPREGIRLIAIAKPLAAAINEDPRIQDLLNRGTDFDEIRKRLAVELGPVSSASSPTLDALVRLLRSAQAAPINRKAAMLLVADRMALSLSGSLGDGKHEAEAESARRQLAPFGVHLGPQFKDGLLYDHELLTDVWRKYPDTEWGEYAFLELEAMGWNPSSDGYSRPTNPDNFRDVVEQGEAFLAKRPGSPVRLQVLFAVATAYETWWSVSLAPASDENYGVYPRRMENDRRKDAARLKAIAAYEQIQKMAPDSAYALFAARHLPRLRFRLDTGYRRWFEVGD